MRGIRESLVARQACGNHIVAKYIRGLNRVSHRLDFLGIDLAQLIDVAHDLSQLDRHLRKLIIRELRAGEQGGTFPCAFNAANEVAVAAFLEGRLPFLGIAETVEETLASVEGAPAGDLDELNEADAEARRLAGRTATTA